MIENIVYEMKAGSLIDESAEFQTNRLMGIKSAQLLVRLVPGGTRCNVILASSCKHCRYNVITDQNNKTQFTNHIYFWCMYFSDVYVYCFSSN